MAYSGVAVAADRSLSQLNKENEGESEGAGGAQKDGIVYSKVDHSHSVEVVDENGRGTHLIRVMPVRSVSAEMQ